MRVRTRRPCCRMGRRLVLTPSHRRSQASSAMSGFDAPDAPHSSSAWMPDSCLCVRRRATDFAGWLWPSRIVISVTLSGAFRTSWPCVGVIYLPGAFRTSWPCLLTTRVISRACVRRNTITPSAQAQRDPACVRPSDHTRSGFASDLGG